MRPKTLFAFIALFALIALFGPGIAPVRASDIRNGDRIVIEADEVIEDDLIVAATIIEVNGTVEGSAIIAGQVIAIDGQVNGSLYAAGFSMTLGEGAAVGRNANFAGYNLTTRPDSRVERDLYVIAAQALHDGAIGGNLNSSANGLEINGQVAGDVTGTVGSSRTMNRIPFAMPGMPDVDLEPVASGLLIGPTAQIDGQVSTVEVAPTPPGEAERGFLGLPLWLTHRLGDTIGLLIVAALLIAVAPRFLPAAGDVLRRKPLPSLGWGLLVYLLFPAAVVAGLALVVLLTLLFGLITFGRYVLLILGLSGGFYLFAIAAFLFVAGVIAWLIVGHAISRTLLSRTSIDPASRMTQFLYVALGVVILQVLRAVPVLGFFVALLVGVLALGALFAGWLERRRAGKFAKPLPVTEGIQA